MLRYKHIEASREVRLWIGQVIIPAIGAGVMIMANPEANRFVRNVVNKARVNIKDKFNNR